MSSDSNAVPTLFGISLNRLIAFGGPYLAVASGAIADWLLVHVHFLSNFHVGQSSIAGAVAQAAVFGITTLVVWLGHQKWLDGFQKWAYQTAVDISNTDVPFDPSGPVALPEGVSTTGSGEGVNLGTSTLPEDEPPPPEGDVGKFAPKE